MATVQFERADYKRLHEQWRVIDDCMDGEIAVKDRGAEYLPMPNPTDLSNENLLRYDVYRKRAVFYNVTRRTIDGLVGLVFNRAPEIDLPTELESLEDNADGGGINLAQIAKDALAYAVSRGKCGILVDYPHADKPLTVAEVKANGIQPTMTVYHPKNIINWRTAVIGGIKKITLVVLVETELVQAPDNEFAMSERVQYRVLRLVENTYTQQLYTNNGTVEGEIIIPKDASGTPFDSIPFFPIGAETNTLEPTQPPAYALASINLAHYRNSADYEESCFIVGQPTPVLTGLTENWVKEIYGDKSLEFGSRAVVMMPTGGNAELLQAQPNMVAKEAMDAKEQQMIALGARLVKNDTANKTATQTNYDATNADSTLSNCAQNVNDGVLEALRFAARFTRSNPDDIEFRLQTDFDLQKMTAEDVKSLISAWQANAITTSEMRTSLVRAGMAQLDYVDYKKEVSEDVLLAAENAATMMEATTPEPTAPVGT